ncbi:MAG: FecR family protein [Flavobacteriaceae bacterium]
MQKRDVLIEKFLSRTISKNERRLLKKWVLQNKENLEFFRNEIRRRSQHTLYHHFDEGEAFKAFMATIEQKGTGKRRNNHYLKYAAICIGLVAIGLVGYLLIDPLPSTQTEVVEGPMENPLQEGHIILTLPDGTKQVISPDGQTTLIDKNGKTIAKKVEEGLDFRSQGEENTKNPVFNEIYVPYGQTLTITLSDHTKVWLNAGTRFRFPQNLGSTAQNRMVYLEGEAYFDVAKDANRPFIVNAQNIDIKVLGTQFNVSAYESDSNIATTLVEGSVNMYENSNPDTKILLRPSYQASFIKENGTLVQKKVDTRIYTGWMHNKLIIDNLSFQEILKRLERTHNVSIINNATHLHNEVYRGEFDNEGIEAILRTIATSTPFNYTMDNNVITISK